MGSIFRCQRVHGGRGRDRKRVEKGKKSQRIGSGDKRLDYDHGTRPGRSIEPTSYRLKGNSRRIQSQNGSPLGAGETTVSPRRFYVSLVQSRTTFGKSGDFLTRVRGVGQGVSEDTTLGRVEKSE